MWMSHLHKPTPQLNTAESHVHSAPSVSRFPSACLRAKSINGSRIRGVGGDLWWYYSQPLLQTLIGIHYKGCFLCCKIAPCPADLWFSGFLKIYAFARSANPDFPKSLHCYLDLIGIILFASLIKLVSARKVGLQLIIQVLVGLCMDQLATSGDVFQPSSSNLETMLYQWDTRQDELRVPKDICFPFFYKS